MAPVNTIVKSALLLATVQATDIPDFSDYLSQHGLNFEGSELNQRKTMFQSLVEKMIAHNNDPNSLWKMGLNKFSVLTKQEMQQYFGYMKMTTARAVGSPPPGKNKELPEDFDWREHRPSVVTAVKDQGGCGSCWAFASTEVMESAVALATGKLWDLSPQQLTSCMPNPQECGGSGGCNGAIAQLAFNYTIQNGLDTQWSYPYTSGLNGDSGECFPSPTKKRPAVHITGYHQLPQNDANALMEAVLVNPVSVSVAASSWSFYSSGIFNGCDPDPVINHAVVLMGYGSEGGNYYWLIRNSWGPTWGEDGYIRVQRFPMGEPCGEDKEPLDGYSCKANPPDSIHVCGMCGVLSDSAYPTGAFLGAPQHVEDPAVGGAQELFETTEAQQIQAPSSTPSLASSLFVAGLAAGLASVVISAVTRARRGDLSYAEVQLTADTPGEA
mmetsp:Transcript_53737/g.114700  ORF Transcript_53737/g.114700 Transcript_53737/m.114700 type:complete len:440 (+) Transcript_53737:120-1439(+)|eukprot:CAMPEP_0206471012 /NCGR_PEP_ID=MMETSP0324_2-20121206/31292_1 /ASSEMBLY_ACC=CAM_ASM_000836 /TAXON_ID=2866 /ORGANISM="Crypthecodinium cohnii, Strain Seligo" /LENGTH=439 /DNA_ID=CAMNT_0053945221 /DNA_START=115 /DNA_END=1434 /DNA_ORIENTATION=-